MSARTMRAAGPADADARRIVARVLDGMQIAERAYHHLNFSAPLVTELVRRVRARTRADDAVLVIGGNSLLIETLAALGVRLDVWTLPGAYLTDETQPYVRRTVETGELAHLDAPAATYACVVMPMLIEALTPSQARAMLESARGLLADTGTLIVATPNQARLELRMSAMAGRPSPQARDGGAVSLSWPAMPTAHIYHRDELLVLARDAGLGVHACDFVAAQQPYMEMELLGVFAYAMRRAGRGVRRLVPSTRDAIVLECGRRAADGTATRTRIDAPSVSVLVSARCGGERLAATLESLARQTYPPDQYEVVVLDTEAADNVGRIVAAADERAACRIRRVHARDAGPRGRNAAMRDVASDITAHTEDTCVLPEDWIESAVTWFDESTAAVTGPVFASDGSGRRYLEVPGTPPDPDEKAPPSEVLFPISNVFYRTSVARAAGGFDETLARGGDGATGWDCELAWRLTRLGWHARFREEVYQFRCFPDDAASRGWVRRQFRQASDFVRLAARAPEFRERALVNGMFASRQTMYFDLALASGALAARRRNPAWLLGATPWLSTISARVDAWPPRNWASSARTVTQIAARQSVWLAGFIAGSIRSRRPVL